MSGWARIAHPDIEGKAVVPAESVQFWAGRGWEIEAEAEFQWQVSEDTMPPAVEPVFPGDEEDNGMPPAVEPRTMEEVFGQAEPMPPAVEPRGLEVFDSPEAEEAAEEESATPHTMAGAETAEAASTDAEETPVTSEDTSN